MHSRSNETGDAHDLVDFDGAGPHAGTDCGSEPAASTSRREPGLQDWLTLVEIGDHSTTHRILGIQDGALRGRTGGLRGTQVRVLQHIAELYILGGHHPRGCLLMGSRNSGPHKPI